MAFSTPGSQNENWGCPSEHNFTQPGNNQLCRKQ